MVMSGDEPHRFLIHDRDSIYSDAVDRSIAARGLVILKTPVQSPKANAFCERVIGTIRRECLDWTIPCNEKLSCAKSPRRLDSAKIQTKVGYPASGHGCSFRDLRRIQ